MRDPLTKVCSQVGLELFQMKGWKRRRVSAHWTCRFARLGSSIMVVSFGDSAKGDHIDWERFLSDREQFLQLENFSDGGVIEIWCGAGALLSHVNVEARPLLYRSLEFSVGRVWSWFGVEASSDLKSTVLLNEDLSRSLDMHWCQDLGEALEAAQAQLEVKTAWFKAVEQSAQSWVRSGLQLKVDASGEIDGFGVMKSEHLGDLETWLTEELKVSGEGQKKWVTKGVGFATTTVKKSFCNVLKRLEIPFGFRDVSDDRLPLESYRDLSSLLKQDVDYLSSRLEAMERVVSQERRRVEEALESKASFMKVVREELKGPMNGMAGMLELLKGTELKDEQKEYVTLASSSCRQLFSTLQQVQDYSALDAGDFGLETQEVSLEGLMKAFEERWQQSVSSKGLHLSTELDVEEGLSLWMDESRVGQLLDELVKNSLAHTEKGGIILKIGVVEDLDTSVRLKLEVSDSGKGMPKDQLDFVFSEFARQDSASRSLERLGFGLAFCQKLASYMGGKMGVFSQEGEGARFWMVVELKKVSVAPESTQVPVVRELPILGMPALIVDDNPITRKVLVGLLESLGFSVEVTGSAFAALELMEAQEYGFVMLDLFMPEMSGFDLVLRLKEALEGTKRSLPIMVGLSRKIHSDVHGQCLEVGMKGLLPKPLNVTRLKQFLESVF